MPDILFSAFASKTVNISVTKLAIRTVVVCFLTSATAYGLFATKSGPKICKYNYEFWLTEAASTCQGLAMTLFDHKGAGSECRTKVLRWGWWRWAGQAASREKGAQHCCRRADFKKAVQSKGAQCCHFRVCLPQPLWRRFSLWQGYFICSPPPY